MPRLRFLIVHWMGLLAIASVFVTECAATPMWTDEQIEADRRVREQCPDIDTGRDRMRRTLDDPPPYFLHYRMLCDFLVSMQFTGAGPNNGGMIEGESGGDQNIIETDNTQEAIRVWSQYAIWTGDTATYHASIDRAWAYCWRYPAWNEGGSFSYYSAHNCGWGFEALQRYREAYDDTSQNIYGDNCAAWMVSNPLNLNLLNAAAEGLGLGGMYSHAVYRARQDWINHTVTRGRVLRNWVQQQPTRLAQEDWALCGGTLFWGIASSLFAAYPDSGVIFLNQYGSNLQVWESNGSWNHSYNAWYANAHHRAFELTGDSTYWNNAVYIGDSLIGLDTDEDGGIYPGRAAYSPANDHSWVSAYMGWMGMERPINNLSALDAAAVQVISPDPSLPHPAGVPFTFAVRVANVGISSLTAIVTAGVGICVWNVPVELAFGHDSVLTFTPSCTIPDDATLPDSTLATVIIHSDDDENRANDTLRTYLDIRRRVGAQGRVVVAGNGSGIADVQIDFRHESYADSIWFTTTTDANGNYSTGNTGLMAGLGFAFLTPAIQFVTAVDTFTVEAENSPISHDMPVGHTECALVDDDVDQSFESYYLNGLSSLGLNVRHWTRAEAATGSLAGIPTVIWFTGNDSLTTLLPWDETTLIDYMNAGGHLLLSGQNITEDLSTGSDFLTAVLSCSVRTHDTNVRTALGVSGHPLIGDSMRLVLQGTQGANNQNSTSSLWPIAGSEPVFTYSMTEPEVAGVSGVYGAGKYLFLGFGIEAVSGASGSTTRAEFFAALMDWFELNSTPDLGLPIPDRISLAQNYPNPFNPGTAIEFTVPSMMRVNLSVYNSLGQEVRTLLDSPQASGTHLVYWNGNDNGNHVVSSGTYVIRMSTDSEILSRTMQLVR